MNYHQSKTFLSTHHSTIDSNINVTTTGWPVAI